MPDTFKFRGDLTCALGVKSLAASLAWYRDVLGFAKCFEIPEAGWAEVQTCVPGVSIGFSEVEKPEAMGGATLTFGVDSIDKARAELESRGVAFDGKTRTIDGMVKLASFFDPDGHKYMLVETLRQ